MLSGGLRIKGITKHSQENTPLITVVTVVYNGEKTLEETILSVINQTYTNIEYIIVDGASKDNTFDVIKKYNDKIDYWISEPDDGLYFAMNKGVSLATGDWINFMNSGDTFYSDTILSEIFDNKMYDSVDMIIGSAFICSTWGNFFGKSPKVKDVWKYFCHQAMFTRRTLNNKIPFDTSYRVSADYNFVYRVYSQNKKIFNSNKVIASIEYSEKSFSIKHTINARKDELRSILSCDNINIIRCLYFFNRLIRAYISSWLQNHLPSLLRYYRKGRDITSDKNI